MSSPYWDGLYSRDAEPPAGLTGVDRESWLRGKQEAEAAKALFKRPAQAQSAAAAAPPVPLAAHVAREGGVNWRRTGLLIGAVLVLLAAAGAVAFYGAPSSAGWLLFAAAVVGLVWRLAGPDVARR
ncbi:MAG TPA: hypothetical protein VF629_08920 [Hymenobacter sp.]|jgi:hypothetical protein|uniref:hypothetical protein n=1 Tax=Hymenobacter sp. TaxID=1898978 RepID=UPI002EDB9917